MELTGKQVGLVTTVGLIALGLAVVFGSTEKGDTPTKEEAASAYMMDAPDGGVALVRALPDGGAKEFSEWPCAWKPTAGARCTKADGGNPGVHNTMQPGEFAGPNCVRKACVLFAGESDEDPPTRLQRKRGEK